MTNLVQSEPINLYDFETLAREKMQQEAFDYYSSGAWDELTLGRNINAYREIALRPRMLVDVSRLSLSTKVLGKTLSMPIIVAPMAFQALAHADGELAMARAAAKLDTIMTLSTLSNYSIEQVAQASGAGNRWFQLYVYKDREVSKSLVERAVAAGFSALVVTVDSPYLGRRERDVRNRFQLPNDMKIGNFSNEKFERFPQGMNDSGLFAYIAGLYDRTLTWKDLEWFVSISKLPVLVKGILRADDAVRAIEYGASGVIVSNHGGRQLDTAISTIEALPEIAEAVGDKTEILVDGGIRRGTDVLKAIAFGAKAILLGRPLLWGLAAYGEAGASMVLGLLKAELELAMALAGCPDLESITPDLIAPNRWTALGQSE